MDATVNYLLENKKSFILELSDSTCNAETDLNKLNDASVLSDLETGSHSHSLILSRPHSPTLSPSFGPGGTGCAWKPCMSALPPPSYS